MSRRKGRRERREAAREQRKTDRALAVGGLEDVFTFHKTYIHGKACCKGVRWKNSTQRFELHLFSGTARRRKEILEHRYKWKKYTHFTVSERGKSRPIDAPHIHDRQIHKVIAQEVLIPLYLPDMIWNNGASMKGKGLAFSRAELVADLCHHFALYGLAGSVIVTDCTGFFPNADHNRIRARHYHLLRVADVRELADSVLTTIPSGKGVPLGVEPSQMEMVAYPSPLDNYMKCQLRLDGAGHYMDDYIMLIPPDLDPYEVFEKFKAKAAENDLTISERKTQIVPFGRPFRFCKAKYTVTETGRVVVHGHRDSAKRGRHKFKAFKPKVEAGEMSYPDLWASVQGVFNYYEEFDDHGRVLSLRQYFYNLYGFSGERYENFENRQ